MVAYAGAGFPPLAFLQLLDSTALTAEQAAQFRRILEREGFSEDVLIQRDVQIPLRWFSEVFPDLDFEEATRLGIEFARQAKPTSLGPLSLALMSAGSIAEMVELMAFIPVLSTALTAVVHTTEDDLILGLSGHTEDPILDCLVVTYAGTVLLRFLELMVVESPEVAVYLSWSAPSTPILGDDPPWERFFFDAPTSYARMPLSALGEVCRFPDPVTHRVAMASLRQVLDQRIGTASYSDRVRRLLEDQPSLRSSAWIAEQLCVSPSTLKRRLQEEGTTFRGLREAIVREHAMVRILDRSMSLSEIARHLGYSEPANFTHAFKRWTGQSPREFRIHHTRG